MVRSRVTTDSSTRVTTDHAWSVPEATHPLSHHHTGADAVNVLDLFSGAEGWTEPFRDRGHDVVTLDIDPRFGADHQIDFLVVDSLKQLERDGRFDIVLASPPCESFSTGSFRYHWHAQTTCERCGKKMVRLRGETWEHDDTHVPLPRQPYVFRPKSSSGRVGYALMTHTHMLIEDYSPTAWIVENPRAMMRNLMPERFERRTVTWCGYGDHVMKPTDLWGGFPSKLKLKPACKNGDPCHEAAPRGARTGTQGKKDAAARGKIPYKLALTVCIAMERELMLR